MFRNKGYLMTLLLLLWGSSSTLGQHPYETSWKKRVTRIINIRAGEQTINASGSASTSIIQRLRQACLNGNVKAYASTGSGMGSVLDKDALEYIPGCVKPDTVQTIDPETGRTEVRMKKAQPLDNNQVSNYQTIEEWTFDPNSGKTSVQTTAVAPLLSVYGDDGNFRTFHTLFFVKYTDINIAGVHATDVFAKKIWADYFRAAPTHTNDVVWKARACRVVEMQEKVDTLHHHLKELGADSTLIQLLAAASINGNINAYSQADDLSKVLPKSAVKQIFADRDGDSMIIINPATEQEEVKRRPIEFPYETVHSFRIVEDWTFNPAFGTTVIQTIAIAPLQDLFDGNGQLLGTKELYYLRYTDALKTLSGYFQYHPANTFAAKIWDSYFNSDTKPTVIEK